jgi:hypothetical protein
MRSSRLCPAVQVARFAVASGARVFHSKGHHARSCAYIPSTTSGHSVRRAFRACRRCIPRGSTMLLLVVCAYLFPATTSWPFSQRHFSLTRSHSSQLYFRRSQVAVLAGIVKSIVAVPLASILLRISSTIKPVLHASPPACKSSSATGTHARGDELVDKPNGRCFGPPICTRSFSCAPNRNLVCS